MVERKTRDGGERFGEESGNGYVETRTHDRAGRLTGVTNKKGATTLSAFAWTLDPDGNPTSSVRTGATSETDAYSYDNLDRLTSVCFQASCPGGSDPLIRWTFDDVGNRLSEARPSGTKNYTYNASDQLTQAGSTTYTYDGNGNEKTAGSTTFNYNLLNQLVSTTSGSTTTTYSYDGLGQRLRASTGSQASKKTNYLWDVSSDPRPRRRSGSQPFGTPGTTWVVTAIEPSNDHSIAGTMHCSPQKAKS
jgi:YD repeat-containing protein